jgi:hypothetical protein
LLWKAVCSSKLLANVDLVLFLNKCDILEKKLDSGIRWVLDSSPYFSRLSFWTLDTFVPLYLPPANLPFSGAEWAFYVFGFAPGFLRQQKPPRVPRGSLPFRFLFWSLPAVMHRPVGPSAPPHFVRDCCSHPLTYSPSW